MGPKKKKASKAREEYLEKKRLDREAAAEAAEAAKEQQQGDVPGGHGDQASAVVCSYSDSTYTPCRKTASEFVEPMSRALKNRICISIVVVLRRQE